MIQPFPDDTFPGAESEPFWFLGGRARILVPGSRTGGTLSVMEFLDTAGHAPPRHIHDDEDEVWLVLDGEVSFFVADKRLDLHAGQIAHGPRGVPHSYLVRSESARLAVVFGPSRVEQWFSANGTPAGRLDEAPAAFDIESILASADDFHVKVAGPPPTA
ncbi:quercetin dioxygenase-like cupin family protein [Catenulispora sp. GAS73]|uniref:cupin domain-containing protein n=1 Tax=Catenulispora sp. GAS73 TaxID=3156269 RepID=UPI0035173184